MSSAYSVCERLTDFSRDGQSPIQGTAVHVDKTVRHLVAVASGRKTAFVEIEAVAPAVPKTQPAAVTAGPSSIPPAPVGATTRTSAKSERPVGPDKASLLLTRPVDFDKTISSAKTAIDLTSGLRRASTAGKALQSASGEHLRLIADISAKIQSQIQAIRAASQIIERRLDLQVQELQRQLTVLKDSRAYIKSFDHKPQVDRAENLLRKQEALASRMDKILQSMPTAYRPQIAPVEQRWFDELETSRTRLYGGGGVYGLGRTRGMISRIESVSQVNRSKAKLTLALAGRSACGRSTLLEVSAARRHPWLVSGRAYWAEAAAAIRKCSVVQIGRDPNADQEVRCPQLEIGAGAGSDRGLDTLKYK